MKKKIEAPLQLAMRIIFADKDFKYSSSIDFRMPDIERFQEMKKDLFERIWSQQWNNGVGGILGNFPKGWRSYDAYAKAFEMVMKAKIKENENRKKRGVPLMGKREWRKGIPMFKSIFKPEDVRIIVVGQNCWTRLFNAKNLTSKVFQKIINDYKI
jgi:hypothetical protein